MRRTNSLRSILGVVLDTDNMTSFGGFPAVANEMDFYTYPRCQIRMPSGDGEGRPPAE